MNIRGLHKTSLVDFPGRICAVLFAGGCNLRCGYCHNPALALNDLSLPRIPEEEVLDFLRKRKNLLDGVVITGGEPTIQKNLYSFIDKVKAIPLEVKLDTNGLLPDSVGRLISDGLLDYVAIDIKTSPSKYKALTGVDVDFTDILKTIRLLDEGGVPYELRTTCVPGYVSLLELEEIKKEIGRVKTYCLQQYVSSSDLLDESFCNISPYPAKVLEEMKRYVLTFADECILRGV